MGLIELQERWNVGGPWVQLAEETRVQRERDLPELLDIFKKFLSDSLNAGEFRHEIDSFGKRTRYAGFAGIAGQMFFNLLVKASPDSEIAAALREALPQPIDEGDCRGKFQSFLAFVEQAREQAKEQALPTPSFGYTPYFLTFFWEAQDRDKWPIYYPASRDTLARHGLFVDKGPYADRYLTYRDHIFELRDTLGGDTWSVEAFLWHLEQEEKTKKPGPSGDGTEVGGGGKTEVIGGETPEPDDFYESLRSKNLIFPDELVTSLVLSLMTKPFVLLTGISGTGKTQLAVQLAHYLESRGGTEPIEVNPPEDDDDNIYIRLTAARLGRGRANLTRTHQQTLSLHGALPDRGKFKDFNVTVADGPSATMRLNNIGFSDAERELFLLFFRRPLHQWLEEHANVGDYLHLCFDGAGGGDISVVDLVRQDLQPVPAQRHEVIAVKSDWTDPRGLIGFHNPITGRYVQTDLIHLLIRAAADAQNPYIVILDEMNLARVEYYFSDFLSAMELRNGTISLYTPSNDDTGDEQDDSEDVPSKLPLPKNVLFIGTVNVDETTFTFSPKVLDRANVLTFNEVDVQRFLEGGGDTESSTFRLTNGDVAPAGLASRDLANAAALKRAREFAPFAETLTDLFSLLELHARHFGYRVLSEMTTFVGLALANVGGDEEVVARNAIDLQLVQKVLPKLNGGRELEVFLAQFLLFCLDPTTKRDVDPSVALEQARKRLFPYPSLDVAPVEPVGNGEEIEDEEDADQVAETPAEPSDTSHPLPQSPPAFPHATRALYQMLVRLRRTGFVAFLE